MTIRRASLILPCHGWDDFPTHLGDQASAELLAGWTALWHPALLAVTAWLPGWYQAEEPPDPADLDGELIVVPPPSRQRMPSDWCERVTATGPKNPAPVETVASRGETIAAVLAGAGIDAGQIDASLIGDFLALGFAFFQVELLTRAMRYSSVLDSENFQSAAVAAAKAAAANEPAVAREELAHAFDLLADARNHVYSVDFYVIDLTLIADSTLGESLRAKLAADSPTNLLVAGEQIDKLAEQHPETLKELQRAVAAGSAAIVGGKYASESVSYLGPEALLAELRRGQDAAQRHLSRDYEVYGQFDSGLSPFLPRLLRGFGFRGALHAAFDGGQLQRADQRKTNWGSSPSASIEALSVTPLDASRAETWIKLAQRIGDSIAHDHVATVLLAGWPGTECEYFDDLRRASKFGPVLGKLITLDEYFRVTREVDDWQTFNPREYPNRSQFSRRPNEISTQVDAYRAEVRNTLRQLSTGLTTITGLKAANESSPIESQIVINAWNFANSYFVGGDPTVNSDPNAAVESSEQQALVPDVLGCGYRAVVPAADTSPAPLAEGLIIRNERLEITINKKSGGIQSVRTHRDRGTRVSQRIVFYHEQGSASLESQMVADRVAISRNDAIVGEITSAGRLVDSKGKVLANYTQRVRAVRGLLPILVDIELDPQQLPEGGVWKSYYASRLAWVDDALAIRRGTEWGAREVSREQIESPEWIEIDDAIGRVNCFAMGLPYHRRAAPNWMDTLLVVEGESCRRFQLAIGLDTKFPSQTAASLLTSGQPFLAELPGAQSAPQGWFIHVGAKNALITHVEPLSEPTSGVRARLLEIEGKAAHTTLSAFRPFRAASITDFRGNSVEVLSVVDGAAQIELSPHRWLQIDAEW